MDEGIRRRLAWLFVVLILDAVLAVVVRMGALGRLIRGNTNYWADYVAVAGLALIVLVVVAVLRSRRDVAALWVHAQDGDEQLAALDATSHDWLWHATPEMVATYCSQATAEVLGYYPDEIVGRPFSDFIHPDDRPRGATLLEESVRAGIGLTDVELRWLHRDGHEVGLQGSGVPVLDRNGKVIGFRGTRRTVPAVAGASRDLVAARRRIEDVLHNGPLRMALQPIIDINRDTLVSVEALARFSDDRAPDIWFREAHDTGLGLELELLAVQTALQLLPSLPPTVSMSVNASPALILDERFPAALTSAAVDLARVVIEITEHEAIVAYEDINAALAPLRQQGVRLAVDDTGAGYASFNHVLHLRPDVIKLDRSLLGNISVDPARRALVTAIVLLALELDAVITAEGVETPDQLATLRSLGVDRVQGYLLARPDSSPMTWRSWSSRRWLPSAESEPAALDASSRNG